MKVKSESEVVQSCPTPSDPADCCLPGSSVHRIFQARVLEWGAIAFSYPFRANSVNLKQWNYGNESTRTVNVIKQNTLDFCYVLRDYSSVLGILGKLEIPWLQLTSDWMLCLCTLIHNDSLREGRG